MVCFKRAAAPSVRGAPSAAPVVRVVRPARAAVVRRAVMAPEGAAEAQQQPTTNAAANLLAAPAGAPAKELLQYDGPLSEVDPEIASIITNEKKRQVCDQQGLFTANVI